ncbi:MAG: protoporphyrinogen oxidase [Candidatus Obscuribacterales bacterium]
MILRNGRVDLMEEERAANEVKRIAIIGGGISGLTAAYTLVKEAERARVRCDITLYESRDTLGGSIRTIKKEGSIMDLGPECFVTTKPALLELFEELGIQERLIQQKKRTVYISRDSVLESLPEGIFSFSPSKMGSLVQSKVLSWPGKLRTAFEVFVPPNHRKDESVAEFVTRRFGAECLERLVEPFVGGVYGNHPESLSARSTLPFLIALEETHGSVIRGLVRSQHKVKRGGAKATQSPMATFDQGMFVLVEELRNFLDSKCVIENKEVISIESGTHGHKWDVHWAYGFNSVDAVIVATPAPNAATILEHIDRPLANQLRWIKHSSPIIVSLLYERKSVRHSLDGSGFVIPRRERKSIRACTFSSSKFSGRTPEGKVLLRLSLNTLTMPELERLSDQAIEDIVTRDLSEYLSILREPNSITITRHHNAIPQLSPGHQLLVQEIESRISNYPDIVLTGNCYSGMGISDCVARAKSGAIRLALVLNQCA